MDNSLAIALVVSGVGMLTLFLALAFLYVLMYLMTTFIKDRPEADEAEDKQQETGNSKQRAAVIGVALARAEQDMMSYVGATGTGKETVGDWWAFHHRRQLTLNRPARRVR